MTATYSRTTAQCGPECEIARARAQISTRRCGSRVSDDMMFYYSRTGALGSHGINGTSACPTELLRSRHGIGTKRILEDIRKHRYFLVSCLPRRHYTRMDTLAPPCFLQKRILRYYTTLGDAWVCWNVLRRMRKVTLCEHERASCQFSIPTIWWSKGSRRSWRKSFTLIRSMSGT